jgi:hypothetical protein
MNECGASVELYLQGKSKVFEEKPIVSICPLQIPRGLAWDRTYASEVKGQ